MEELQFKLQELGGNNLFQSSGFTHPKMFIYPNKESLPIIATWGLVPHWVKDEKGKVQIWNNTLNARGESIFEKPSFRDAAKSKRCLLYLDGFYEHHHLGGKTYPFFIRKKDNEPFPVAWLWSEWLDKETRIKLISFSIVTTIGNEMMAKIHNNPKLEGPRMPVILPDKLADIWIEPSRSQKELTELLLPLTEGLLHAHTVYKIAGKDTKGNNPEAEEEFIYSEIQGW